MAAPRRPAERLVQLRHPDPKKKMPRMPKDSYAIAHRIALAVLPNKAPGIALKEFIDEMAARLPKVKGWDRTASARWYAMAIKLDMEARGEIKRVNIKPPQRIVRADRVAFVKQGRLVHELALRGAPAAVDVEIRLSSVDRRVLDGLAGLAEDVAQIAADRVRLRVADERRLPAITRWLVEQGQDVYTVAARRKSLEEWFVEVVGEEQRPG